MTIWHKTAAKYVLLVFVSLIVGAPIIYALIVATQSITQIMAYPPNLIIGDQFVNNLIKAWEGSHMGRLLVNSFIVASSIAGGKIFLALLAAFAITYFKFRGKQLFFALILITHMLPLAVRIVPTYRLMATLGWIDTYFALIFPFLASATSLLLFRQLFLTVPLSLADAARMDGVSPLGYLFKIMVPLSRDTIAALFVVEFIWAWNEYLWPLIITDSPNMRVVQVGIKLLMPTDAVPDWNIIMAGVVISLLTPLIILILLRKQFLKGLALQEMK